MNTNAAAHFDRWLLNLLPAYRDKPFVYNPGGYQTLNFIPSMATMLFGLMAGELLRGRKSGRAKLAWLVAAGLICSGAGSAGGMDGLPDRQAHLDAVVGGLQRRLGVLDAGGFLRHMRSERVEKLVFPAYRGWHELHRDVLHVADAQAGHSRHVSQSGRRMVVFALDRPDLSAGRAVLRRPDGVVAGVLLAVSSRHLCPDLTRRAAGFTPAVRPPG